MAPPLAEEVLCFDEAVYSAVAANIYKEIFQRNLIGGHGASQAAPSIKASGRLCSGSLSEPDVTDISSPRLARAATFSNEQRKVGDSVNRCERNPL